MTDKYTEPTAIIDSHVGHYMTAYALEWCLDNGWSPDDIDHVRHTAITYLRDGQAIADHLWEQMPDMLDDAEDWATENLTPPDSDLYFGSHPDIGDWGVWPTDENWPN